MSQIISSVKERAAAIPAGERWLVAMAMGAGFAAVAAYVLLTRSHALAGDESEYHRYGVLFTEGHLWWSTTPFDEAHPSAWKAPGYPAWVGALYAILGSSPLRVELVQAAILAPLTVFLAWALARRLFGPKVGLATAFVTALFPLSFEYFGLLFPEALAIPLVLATMYLVLEREPSTQRSAWVGALIGVGLLVRPTSFFLLAGATVAWIVAAGWGPGLKHAALTTLVAALVVAPWTIRNALTEEVGFIPISVQDAALYGTFNEDSATDDERPYQFRAFPDDPQQVLDVTGVESEAEFRANLQEAAFEYMRDNPASVPKAVYYNGLTRLWDLRPPDQAVDEVEFQGRSETVRWAGLIMYYPILLLALVGVWRARARHGLVLPVITMAAVATLAFSVVAGTRYRAPFEPVLAMLAAAAVLGVSRRTDSAELGVASER